MLNLLVAFLVNVASLVIFTWLLCFWRQSRFFLFLIFFPVLTYGAQISRSDSTWGPLTKFVLELFTGDPAIIASLIAFFMGIVLAMRTQHKLTALFGGLIIAVAFQIGPNVVEHLTGALV